MSGNISLLCDAMGLQEARLAFRTFFMNIICLSIWAFTASTNTTRLLFRSHWELLPRYMTAQGFVALAAPRLHSATAHPAKPLGLSRSFRQHFQGPQTAVVKNMDQIRICITLSQYQHFMARNRKARTC